MLSLNFRGCLSSSRRDSSTWRSHISRCVSNISHFRRKYFTGQLHRSIFEYSRLPFILFYLDFWETNLFRLSVSAQRVLLLSRNRNNREHPKGMMRQSSSTVSSLTTVSFFVSLLSKARLLICEAASPADSLSIIRAFLLYKNNRP